ncbi:AAEL007752-PA [Aedes aegypti]|uniref:Cytochrome c oxidase subunit VIIa n=2 Tax=Aedes aegypti TaxID=7159 RepID=Q1HRM7_AEDAE|nr:cytochrome c oxidase subunit 7A, mitochondrial [Aedes aegypti]ABF18100.1 cytochrome c oxidase subunit VIIa [Aedes aegypti]EAT40535.1 AAEL007752-PA [Aedes aegypti]
MSARNIARLAVQTTRQFSKTPAASSGEVAEGYKQLKHIQAKFQKPDGKPVHLKGGPVDQVLFMTTSVLCVVGLLGIGKLIYELSYPKQEE